MRGAQVIPYVMTSRDGAKVSAELPSTPPTNPRGLHCRLRSHNTRQSAPARVAHQRHSVQRQQHSDNHIRSACTARRPTMCYRHSALLAAARNAALRWICRRFTDVWRHKHSDVACHGVVFLEQFGRRFVNDLRVGVYGGPGGTTRGPPRSALNQSDRLVRGEEYSTLHNPGAQKMRNWTE